MMMRARLVLVGLLLAAVGALVWMGVANSRQSARIASLESELRAAEARVIPPPVVPEEPITRREPDPPPKEAPPPAAIVPPINPEIDQLRAQLLDAQTSVARLQARVEEMDKRALEAIADRARISGTELTARAQIDELTRKLDALAAERPAQEKRLRELEADNERLREHAAAAGQRSGQVGRLANEWQDLSQRQQVYLTNAMRRFRELTDLLRRMPGNLEMKGNGPELTRVQSVISMADEDLRQLNDLAVRLGRVQKQLAALK
jgi:chromosome segregation ATPase